MDNIQVKGNIAKVRINAKVYPIEAVYSAAYIFLDRAYIVLDGEPGKEICVSIQPKSGNEPAAIAQDFCNELISYSDYQKRSEKTRQLREMIMQRAIITNDPKAIDPPDDEFEKLMAELDDEIDDPEGIAVPWEEKYHDAG